MKGGKEKPVFLFLFPDNADLEGIAGMKHFGKIHKFRLQVLTIHSIILCRNGGNGMPKKERLHLQFDFKAYCYCDVSER